MNESTTIPVTEDELVVGRRTVEVGTVRITKTVDEREALVDKSPHHPRPA